LIENKEKVDILWKSPCNRWIVG